LLVDAPITRAFVCTMVCTRPAMLRIDTNRAGRDTQRVASNSAGRLESEGNCAERNE